MNKQNLFVSSVIGVLAVLASIFLGGTQTVKEITHEVKTGAVVSNDLDGNYFSYGGVRHYGLRADLAQGTTTVCAIQSPAGTSSLRAFGISETVSSTTASVTTTTKATTAFATTTLLGAQVAVAANAQAMIVGSTTAAQNTAGADVFAPNTWIVFGQQGGTGTFSPTGQCYATWVQMSY